MAQKRMFSKTIVNSDAFMDMPQSTQLLYFHLAMEADDDGFVSNPKRIMRTVGSGEDDYKILVAKRFILPFPSGICVIKHWLLHNYIQSDRYKETKYLDEKSQLTTKENKSYTEKKDTVPEVKEPKKLTDDLPDWLDRDWWTRWLKYKAERKEKMTKTTIEFQIKRLEKLGIDIHTQIIEQAMAQGWKGFYPLKGEGRETKETHDL